MVAALFILATLVAGASEAGGRLNVTLAGAAIRVGDIVGGLPPRVAAIEIARLPTGRSEVTLPRAALAALVRRAVPALALGDGPASVTFRRGVKVNDDRTCFATRSAIGVGEAIDPAKLFAKPCAAEVETAVRYDRRSGASIAVRGMAVGESIGAALPVRTMSIAPGAKMTLVSRSGPVTIERPVTALQAGEAGRHVFVRSGDGAVFAIPVVGDAS